MRAAQARTTPTIVLTEPEDVVVLRDGSLRSGMGIAVDPQGGWLRTSWQDHGQWERRPLRIVGPDEPEQVPVEVQRALGAYARQWPASALNDAFRRWAMLDAVERTGQAVHLLCYAITDDDGLSPEAVEEKWRDEVEANGERASVTWCRHALEWMRIDHHETAQTPHEAWEAIKRWYPLASAEVVNPWLLVAIKRHDEDDLSPSVDLATLTPDGSTVIVPDGDLGFTVPLSEWRRLGGRDLRPSPSPAPNHIVDPLTLTPTRSAS